MRLLSWGLALALFVPLVFADTAMILARQKEAPVQFTSTTHSLTDTLEAAKFKNKSGRTIYAYRMGWAVVKNGKTTFRYGRWMNVPSGIRPEATQEVPAQAIPLATQAQKMIFFVSEVQYAGDLYWKVNQNSISR